MVGNNPNIVGVMSAAQTLKAQWKNPSDIFSLLLIIGGDIIQKAIARLAGVQVSGVHINPVAFSFGWVSYGFMTLAGVLGHQRLMPNAETDIKVIDCDTGYDRDNRSWVLSRLLQDREDKRIKELDLQKNPPEHSTGAVSLVIDIFVANTSDGPSPGLLWWFGWLIIIAQICLATVAWVVEGQWPIFMITVCGTLLSVITASLPQWIKEKWPSRRLDFTKKKPVALTRGNGHRYVMLIKSYVGSWDLEAMASSRSATVPGTRWILGLFAGLWVLLLITVTGIKTNTWYLVGVGGLGMMQNIFAAAWPCSANELDIQLEPWKECPTIVGYQRLRTEKNDLKAGAWQTYTGHDPTKPTVISDAETEYNSRLGPAEIKDVMGALMELEKYSPRAGASLIPTFFPNNVSYEPGFHIPRETHFWKYAETRA